jgi:5-(carboxyamino)imidazole ribonucleotide synthase
LILEAFVPFVAELSAIVARGADGALAVFDAVENRHRDHILDLSFAPARVASAVAAAAQRHAAAVATALDLVGVLALELFLLPDGSLLGNEIAPRPHNSGHWTMDACAAGQFEQHIRAIAGLPLGAPVRHHDAVMRNLVGPEGAARWPELLKTAEIVPHLYGKTDLRPGRKLGHANKLLPLGSLGDMSDSVALSGL